MGASSLDVAVARPSGHGPNYDYEHVNVAS